MEFGFDQGHSDSRNGRSEVLRWEDIDLADPAAGEVQVRHLAIGLNFLDLYFRTGAYKAPLPLILGNEAAGEVVAVGKGTKHFKEGDRVAYAGAIGAYAEARNIPAEKLVHLPKSISYETAAAMMLKGLTAHYLIHGSFKLKKSHTALIHAAAGGVGQILTQWAALIGAKVIATVGSPDKVDLARKAGADEVILYREENVADRVREITGGKMCDVVYDGIGKDTFPASLDCLKRLGMFVSFGSASGPVEAFSLSLLQQKGSLFATRPTLFDYTTRHKDLQRMADDLIHVVSREKITIPIHASYPLAEVAAAHTALAERRTTGATVLIP